MALTSVSFCKPTVTENKKQSLGFQPMHLLSHTAMMHPSKKLDFPYVPLIRHKELVDTCIPPNFNVSEPTKCDSNFSFVKSNNFANARSIFKNETLKGCHQFPMISISSLVGGFVGSKSQVRSENRESHQVWDIVFRKLDEFVHSKEVETYADRCYQLQELSQNLIGSLCHDTGSALGLSYILADTCQSFPNFKGSGDAASSSHTPKVITGTIPSPKETTVPLNPASTSPSPSICSIAGPAILNIVEHLISQPELPKRVESTATDNPAHADCIPARLSSIVSQTIPNPLCATPSSLPAELKQTYAEVAKMAQSKLKADQDRHHRIPKKCTRKTRDRRFGQNRGGSFQRCMDTNRRNFSPGMKDSRRDNFRPGVSPIDGNRGRYRRNEQKSEVPTYHGYQSKNIDGLKYCKNMPVSYKSGCLKTVPESIVNAVKRDDQIVGNSDTVGVRERRCPYYNQNKNACTNWRCRQHVQKPSVKREMKCLLMDNLYEDNYNQTGSSDVSPNLENSDITVNTFESYFEKPLALSKLTRNRFDDRSLGDLVVVVPVCTAVLPCENSPVISKRDGSTVQEPGRSRSLSETVDGPSNPDVKDRTLSECGGFFKNVPRCRSISEESKSNSSSSLSSANSGALISDCDSRRRYSSECDSEDSFVIFDGGDTSSESSDDDSESEDEDVVDAACVRAAPNLRADGGVGGPDTTNPTRDLDASPKASACSMKTTPPKKVRFVSDERLETVHLMVAWDFAYRAARCGPWEEMARDRERFKQRVARSEPILAPVLGAAHRADVLRRRRREGAPCGIQQRLRPTL